MAKQQGLFDDFVSIASKLPVWICGVAAIAAYVGLHYIANISVPATGDVNAAGEMVIRQALKTGATVMQYVVPVALLVGTIVGALNRGKRGKLYDRAGSPDGMAAVSSMTWREFELLIGEALRRRGFRVIEREAEGADGGIDLVLVRGNETHLVQCKHWRATKVSVTGVRELYGVMAARGAAGGIVVTGGDFTKDARDFAEGRNIELIGGPALAKLLRTVEQARVATPQKIARRTAVDAARNAETDPACPRCGNQMVKRVARRGSNAGNAFWGCSQYPNCRGVRAIG